MDLQKVQQEIKIIKKEVDAVNKLVNDIVRIDKKREGNLAKIDDNLTKLEKKLQVVGQINTPISSVLEWIQHYRDEIAAEQEVVEKKFGRDLAKLLQEQGLKLTGQYPRLNVGLFTIDLDFKSERVKIWYGPEQELLDQCALAPDVVVAAIERGKKNLGSTLDQTQYLKQLSVAVKRVIGLNGDQSVPVPIIKVLAEMAHLMQPSVYFTNPIRDNFRGYSRAEFSYDLFRMRDVIGAKYRLSIASRAQTRNRRDFLWIPSNESGEGSTFSHIQLKG